MSFIGIMLAVFCGVWLYDISASIVKVMINRICDRDERKIGFGDNTGNKKEAKGTQMRKIGFGAND